MWRVILGVALIGIILIQMAESCDYCSLRPGNQNTFCKYAKATNPARRCRKVFKQGMSASEKQAILDVHNSYRRKVAKGEESALGKSAANMRELTWSDELAKLAQLWANQCKFQHDKRATCAHPWVGQNIAIRGTSGTPKNHKSAMATAVKNWYDEVEIFGGSSTDSYAFNFNTGHFTQIIWAETTELGCGFIAHQGYQGGRRFNSQYTVCNYGTAGNMMGSKIFITGPACSKCPKGTKCNDGLCA